MSINSNHLLKGTTMTIRYLLSNLFCVIQIVFEAFLYQTGFEAEALEGKTKSANSLWKCFRLSLIVNDLYLNDLDNISSSEQLRVKLDLCFFGCQSDGGTEDPFGCGELGLNVVDT